MFVLDGSVALAMLLPDEDSAAVDALAGRFSEGTVLVPTIWPLEVRNGLLSALRSRRITAAQFDERLEAVAFFAVEVQPPAEESALRRMATLARQHGLSIYDVSYLDLASERALPLASLDARLRKACRGLKIQALP